LPRDNALALLEKDTSRPARTAICPGDEIGKMQRQL
jgi:hypothetical protein